MSKLIMKKSARNDEGGGGGGGTSSSNISPLSPKSNGDAANVQQQQQKLQTSNSSSLNAQKRKSLILCDIRNSSNDDDDEEPHNDDDDNDNFDNNVIIIDDINEGIDHSMHDTDADNIADDDDDDADDDDDELMCNSLIVNKEQCCETIKIMKNKKHHQNSSSQQQGGYDTKVNTKNNKSINNLSNSGSNNTSSYHLNSRNLKKLNQHQIEYDSQGEEEGFIDSSMESAIEIKDEQNADEEEQQEKQQQKENLTKMSKKLQKGLSQSRVSKKYNKISKKSSIKKNDKNNHSSDQSAADEDNDHDVIDIDGSDNDIDDHTHNDKRSKMSSIQNKINNFNNLNNSCSGSSSVDNNTIITRHNYNPNMHQTQIANPNGSKSANELICNCCNRDACISLKDIVGAFNAPISEEQAWALIFQTVKLYRDSIVKSITSGLRYTKVNVPNNLDNLSLHLDGSVHISYKKFNGGGSSAVTSHKKILHKIGHVIFLALDYNLQADEDCIMSQQLEHLISQMTAIDDIDDEGIERDSEDCEDLDDIIEACIPRVQPSVPEDHYKAVCHAFATEAQDLRIFLQKVFHGDTQALRIKADAVDSNQELDKLGFNDWARFWMQVVDELRQGVRLKRRDFRDVTRTPVEFELTPYEILMEDIRAKKYSLRKVMVNGDIPPRVKKDAHAVILEFIRSRPPLKKASERKLPPPVKRNPSPREQLMDSIRQGRSLKPVPQPTLKNRLLPSTSQHHESHRRDDKSSIPILTASTSTSLHGTNNMTCQPSSTSSSNSSTTAGSSSGNSRISGIPHCQKLKNKIDISNMMSDAYADIDELDGSRSNVQSLHRNQQQQRQHHHQQQLNNFSQPKMPAYPIAGYASNNKDHSSTTNAASSAKSSSTTSSSSNKTAIRRTTYDLATQCESRRASMRRHTIVGCQSVGQYEPQSQSQPPSRPGSRQSNCQQQSTTASSRYPNQMSASAQAALASGPSSSNYETTSLRYQTKSNHSGGGPTPTISTTNLSAGGSSSSNHTTDTYQTKKKDSDETSSQWMDKNTSDRLSLTLEEIVHIRSVMTKAELEGLPVGVRVKEEVEKRKICFLCLRTRFTIFVWGIQCKLCQRTVCSKCYSKMRIPTEHFRNVPVVLLSPSLIGSPASSSAGSPCHHGSMSHPNSSIDETFPKTLMERLMRSESNRKARNSVGSAPSSPKNQRSNMSTPGVAAVHTSTDLMTKSSDSHTLLSNGNNKENNGTTLINGGIAANRQVAGIMSRSVEGPRSLPMQSPGRAHSNCSTLERKNRFARALTLSSSSHGAVDLKENLRGEMMAVCNDCRDLVLEIIRSSRQHRSMARNQAIKNLTLDISPVYK